MNVRNNSQAISDGRFLKAESSSETLFSYVLSRVLHPESNRMGLALLRVLAILWWEASRPVSFLLGHRSIFLRCCHFRRTK